MIRLSVPGTLEYRDVAMRVVSAASKLVQPRRRSTKFDAQVVSAFGEAFNNIAIHGYVDEPGEVEVEIELEDDGIRLRITDRGRSFDPLEVPDPELDDLPERGMGLFIIRSFVDRMVYTPGDPNVLELEKRCIAAEQDSAPPQARSPDGASTGPRSPDGASTGPRSPDGASVPPATARGRGADVKASKSGRAGPSRVRPVRRADSAPPRARADNLSLPLGSRRK